MGLFGNYFKEGPGVNKNAPKKKGLALFIDILGNQFSVMRNTGVVCGLIGLPVFVVYLLLVAPQFTDVLFGTNVEADLVKMKLFVDMILAGVLYNFFGFGPASTAYAHISKMITRGEHVWFKQDCFGSMRYNAKNGIVLTVVDMLVLFTAGNALKFYSYETSSVYLFLQMVIIVLLILYGLAHIFMYQIMIL